MDKSLLIREFSKLFISISSIPLNPEDNFLVLILHKQLAAVFQSFIKFLEEKDNFVSHGLELELNSLTTTLLIFFYFKKIPRLQFLKLKRDLLTLQRSLLNFKETPRKKEKSVISQTVTFNEPKNQKGLNQFKKKILRFINNEGETLNSDVFNQFKDTSRRTLKRHLSELMSMGYIDRDSRGKKVYYKKLTVRLHKMSEEAQS